VILGSLIDAGLTMERLRRDLENLGLQGYELKAKQVVKNGFKATKIDVLVADDVPERHLKEILEIVEKSQLPADIKGKATELFTRLARIEAGIHGTSLDHVHLHELGGIDTMVDVVGAFLGLAALGVEKICFRRCLTWFRRGLRAIPLRHQRRLPCWKGLVVARSEL
jgi:uncharacterized protein (DUF111 family)